MLPVGRGKHFLAQTRPIVRMSSIRCALTSDAKLPHPRARALLPLAMSPRLMDFAARNGQTRATENPGGFALELAFLCQANTGRTNNMTKRWISLFPCASIIFALAASCGNSDNAPQSAGGSGPGGQAGNAGENQSGGGGRAGAEEGGTAGVEHRGGAAGAAADSAGAAGIAGAEVGEDGGSSGTAGAAGADGGAGGSQETAELPKLSPSEFPELAFWMDGKAQSFSDVDENVPTSTDNDRIRSMPENAPLTGHWQAPSRDVRPIRAAGAVSLKPVATQTGFYLINTQATIQTDDSTLALSFRPLNGFGGASQGGLSAPIGLTAQSLGIFFLGNSVGLRFNHTSSILNKKLTRGAHVSIIVRFTATGAQVLFDINGLRTSESVPSSVAHELAKSFILGFDGGSNSDIYGHVSQAVGINRAVSDDETSLLMNWLAAQPIPNAFETTEPLVAVMGDSIAAGDQVPGWQSWSFGMLGDWVDSRPDVQLLNAATNGSGIPKVKNSDYSDVVLPFFSASRTKNILVLASGSNDIAGGNNIPDMLDRYYALLDAARTTGWKTVACTVLPRSEAGMAKGVSGFEADRATFNADIVAHWASHADALADVAAIPLMGAPGASDNTTYYVDQIHPTAAGHALLKPVYEAAVEGLL